MVTMYLLQVCMGPQTSPARPIPVWAQLSPSPLLIGKIKPTLVFNWVHLALPSRLKSRPARLVFSLP